MAYGDLVDSGVPSYMVAADNHTIANNKWSMMDAATLGTGAVIGSALTQVYNILPALGNLTGGNFEEAKTKEVLQSFDDNMGKYYEDHQQGVDALGFVLSSIVPGTAGVKVFNGGQKLLRGAIETGTIGGNMGKALGLLAPAEPKLLSQAIQTALQPNAGFPVWNGKTLAAIASGIGQSAMEGAAFETAVAASMHNSPVLKDQDFGDITSNILHSAAAFGVLGGVVKGAGVYSKIKGAAKVVDAEAAPWSYVKDLHESAPVSDRILTLLEDLHTTPKVPEFTGDQAWKGSKFAALAEDKARTIETKVRELTAKMVGEDQELASTLYTNFSKQSFENVQSKLYGTVEAGRLGQKLQTEVALDSAWKKLDVLNATDEEIAAAKRYSVTYTKVAGEDIGKVTASKPDLLHIADSIGPKQSYQDVVAGYKQGIKSVWNPEETTALESEARYVTALNHKFVGGEVIPSTDLPYLQSAMLQGRGADIEVKLLDGSKQVFQSNQELKEFLIQQKGALSTKLLSSGDRSFGEVAKITDTKSRLQIGEMQGDAESNLFVTKSATQWATPQWVKSVKDTTQVKDIDGNVLEGLRAIKQKQVLFEEAADRAVSHVLGEDYVKFYRISDQQILKANRNSVGGGMLSSQNEGYGTLGSLVQNLGSQTLQTINKFKGNLRDRFNPVMYRLGQNQDAAIEWATLNATLRQFPETFTYDAATKSMRPLALVKYERALQAGEKVDPPVIHESVPLQIPVRNSEVHEMAALHQEQNAENLDKLGSIRKNQGMRWDRDPETFYPIPVNPRDYPHFAFVVDDSISGFGHSKMLHAATPQDLENLLTKVKSADPTLKVLTKNDAEAFYKSVGQYDYERTLTDATFDGALQRKGISSPYVVSTDPEKILNDTLNWHLDRQTNLVREAVLHQNDSQVRTLRSMGEAFANVTESHYSQMDALSYLEMQGKNPYADYVRSMLGLSTSKEFPFWTPLNDMLDRKVSSLFNAVAENFKSMKSPAELDSINKSLQDSGYKGAAYDAMTNAYANHTAPKGVLSSFIAKANAMLATFILRLDPINALNNAIGSNVLLMSELKALTRAIESGSEEGAGALAKIGKLQIPGTGDSILSPTKLIANSMARFSRDSELMQLYKDRGLVTSVSDQYKWVLDNLALTGKESAGQLDSKISEVFSTLKTWGNKGEALTGNRLAEEFNRFVAADVAKQLTDLAVAHAGMGEKEAWAYINTFVNRTQGNYIAAQRPGVFQGPVGQAIGLFQTYQFNMIQQLLRHVGEGAMKDAAVMLGMQSTLYGMKGLPAFDAINTHLVGNASGNVNHRDLYDTVIGAAGKDAGEWLLYGVGSNALGLISPDLKMNLYTRGDINPRNVTLLPVNPADIPFVQAAGKIFGSLKSTATSIAQGGNVWQSLMQGIEHAGVNRPLAGMAQVLEAAGNPMKKSYSTSNQGNIQSANDFLSLANLTRISGAKPLEEAIVIDKAFNLDVYAANNSDKMAVLGKSIKTTLIAGQQPTQDQTDKFAESYAKAGGKQEKFAQFMMQQYKIANTSQANTLANNLNSPFSQSMQQIMGGYRLQDLVNQ